MRPLLPLLILITLLANIPSAQSQETAPQWEKKWEMRPGIYRVLLNNKIGIIDQNGNILVPCIFDQVYGLDKNNNVKVLKDLKIGLYNLDRGQILKPEYDQIWLLGNGKIKMLKDGKTTYLDKDFTKNEPVKNNDEKIDEVDIDIDITSLPINPLKEKRKRFSGHLTGIIIGINGYLDNHGQENVSSDYSFMNTIHEKSIEFSIYFLDKSIALTENQAGIVTAIGLKYNNYRFDINQMSDINNNARSWFSDLPDDTNITKSKLNTLNISIPLVLEFQIPDKGDCFYISGGVEGNLKLKSQTKLVYYEKGKRIKRKNKNDFGLSELRYNLIARAGYNNFGIYSTYSPVALFKKDKGPELYPYSAGVLFFF